MHQLQQAKSVKIDRMLHVSYSDKVWMQGSSEGSFGAWTHTGAGPVTVTYTGKDFTHWDAPTLGTLNVDQIGKTDLYAAVTKFYKAS
jgi:hypothetical protein